MRKFYHQYSSINVSLTKLSHKALARSFNLFTASNSWHSSVRHRKKVPNVEPPCGIIEAAVGYKPWKWIPKKAITLHSAPSWIFIVNFPDLASTQFRIRSVFKNFHSGERIQKVGDSYDMPDTPDTCGRKPKLRIQEYSDTRVNGPKWMCLFRTSEQKKYENCCRWCLMEIKLRSTQSCSIVANPVQRVGFNNVVWWTEHVAKL